jgi:hypothetical protein
LLEAVYSLIYAQNYSYDDRQHALGSKDVEANVIRANDMSSGRVWSEGKWTAGFSFNNALYRISATYHRVLKIVPAKQTRKVYAWTLRPEVEVAYPDWKNTNLGKIHAEVNELKHIADGIFQGSAGHLRHLRVINSLNP